MTDNTKNEIIFFCLFFLAWNPSCFVCVCMYVCVGGYVSVDKCQSNLAPGLTNSDIPPTTRKKTKQNQKSSIKKIITNTSKQTVNYTWIEKKKS